MLLIVLQFHRLSNVCVFENVHTLIFPPLSNFFSEVFFPHLIEIGYQYRKNAQSRGLKHTDEWKVTQKITGSANAIGLTLIFSSGSAASNRLLLLAFPVIWSHQSYPTKSPRASLLSARPVVVLIITMCPFSFIPLILNNLIKTKCSYRDKD